MNVAPKRSVKQAAADASPPPAKAEPGPTVAEAPAKASPPVNSAAADPSPVVIKAEPEPAVAEVPAKASLPVAAIVNWGLAAIGIEAAALILRLRWPWVADATIVTLIATSVIAACGMFMFLFDEETKKAIRSLIGHPAVRYSAIALLVVETIVAFIVLPPPGVIRVVPGPQLDEKLAIEDDEPGRTLIVEAGGNRFELDSPPPRALYASTDRRLALFQIGNEDRGARDEMLEEIIENPYRIKLSDTDSVGKMIRHFTLGRPVLMTAKGASSSRAPVAIYKNTRETITLRLSNVEGQGIDTYVAESP